MLGSVWPLGSVFLSLLDRSLCSSLPSLDSNPLLRRPQPPSGPTPNPSTPKPPALSARLTSPAPSTTLQEINSLRPPSSPKTSVADHIYSPHLAHRLDPFPEPFRTSSNRIECKSQFLRTWGPTSHKQSRPNPAYHYYRPDFTHPHKRSSFSDNPAPHSSSAIAHTAANDLYLPKPKPVDPWKHSNQNRFQDNYRGKKKKLNSIDWDWGHWTQADDPRSEDRGSPAKMASPHLNKSFKNRSPSASLSAGGGASVDPLEWKKKLIQGGSHKFKGYKSSDPSSGWLDQSGFRHKRPKLSFGSDHHHHQVAHRRSISPSFLSPHADPIPRKVQVEASHPDYFRLSKLHPALRESIGRAVYSWVNQTLVESFWKVGIWFEDAKKWKSDQWGVIRLDQFEQIVDLTYSRPLSVLLRACKTDRFLDLIPKPVHSGIFLITRDNPSNLDYLKLTKDFTPIGLLYRPIIKGLRRQRTETGQNRIQIEEFVRHYLIQISEEEDLIYLFQNDDDPYGCIKRAVRDGIISIYEDEFTKVSAASCIDHIPGHLGNNSNNLKRKRVEFEDHFISLKSHWGSNKETLDILMLPSPTISQGGSSGVQHAEEEFKASGKEDDAVWAAGGKDARRSSSKTSSTNTDADPHPRGFSPKLSVGNSLPGSTHLYQQFLTPPPDDALIQSIIDQLKENDLPRF